MKKIDEMTKEELVTLVKEVKKRKKYGLVWEDKPEDVVEQCKKELPILVESKDKAIEKDENQPINFIIEGDNYHSLSALNYTHAGKVDIIYIDPPYNTGGSEFRYNDKAVDKTDSYRHSKWIGHLSSRLRLAKNLLSENGLIFISIDNNEVASLRLLCDEIFTEDCFVEQIVWKNKYGAGAKTVGFISVHEYILCYSRRPIKSLQTVGISEEELKKHNKKDEKFDLRGGYRTQPLATRSLGDRPNLVYPIHYKGQEILPDKQWVWSRERMEKAIANNEVEFTISNGKYSIRAKQYIKDDKGQIRKGKPLSIIDNCFTQDGTKELKEIFGNENVFPFPKPTKLLMQLVNLIVNYTDNKNYTILDFYAGSGTTGHAVLKLNSQDQGRRQFILCTNNEKDIAEKVCYPRIMRAINGYSDIKAIPANVKYFRTDFVYKSKVSDDTRKELVKGSTEMICIRENTFEKVIDKHGFKIYKDAKHTTGVLFNLDDLAELKSKLKEQNLPTNIYVFSLTNDTFNEDFEDLELSYELCPIPESILEVYRKLFK